MFLSADLALAIPFTFMALAGVFAGTMLWYKHKAAMARAAALRALAQTLGMPFSETDSFGLAAQLQSFDLFRRERSRWFKKGRVTNVMRGNVGDTEVMLFDYSYIVQAGKSQKRITQTVFFANDKNWFLPNFRLKPENWWLKLKSKLGMGTDINFEENPEFSEKYWLKGELEDLVRQQFTPQLQGFLTEKPPANLEGNNYYLIAYKPRKAMSVPDAKQFFDNCCEVVKMLQKEGKTEILDLAELRKEDPIELKQFGVGNAE